MENRAIRKHRFGVENINANNEEANQIRHPKEVKGGRGFTIIWPQEMLFLNRHLNDTRSDLDVIN